MNTQDTFWLTVEIQVLDLLTLVAVVIFLTIPRPGKVEYLEFGILLACSWVTEVIGTVGYHFLDGNMNLAGNIYNLIDFPLLVLLYRKKIHWFKKNTIATIIIISYLCFGLVNLFFIQGIHNFDSYTNTLASICFIVTSISYFYVLIQQLPTDSITKLPMFWINSAMLIFYSGTFLLSLTGDYLIRVLKNDLITYWMIYHLFRAAYLGMILYAFILIIQEYRTKRVVSI